MSEESWWVHGVSAVLITRGDCPLEPVLYSLPFKDIVIWNAQYLKPQEIAAQMYGRYMAVEQCKNDLVYVQDDDCIVDARQLAREYKPGMVTCNMPYAKRVEYEKIAPNIYLVGWGAIFHKDRLNVFDGYMQEQLPVDELFYREADRVFTYLNPVHKVDVPFRHLPNAYDKNRMGSQPDHLESLAKIQERLRSVSW